MPFPMRILYSLVLPLLCLFGTSSYGTQPTTPSVAECLAHLRGEKVEILVQGERHQDPQIRLKLLERAKAGEIFLVLEGARWGETVHLTHVAREQLIPIELSPKGPIYGFEHPQASELALLVDLALQILTRPDQFFASDFAKAKWLIFVTHVQAYPETWQAVSEPLSHREASFVALVDRLIALENGKIWGVITSERAFPALAPWYRAILLMALRNIELLKKERPSLEGWLEIVRSLFLRQTFAEMMVPGIATLNCIRERFMAENLARLVAENRGGHKPYVVLVGGVHVVPLASVLQEMFVDHPQISIRSEGVPLDPIAQLINHVRVGWRPK